MSTVGIDLVYIPKFKSKLKNNGQLLVTKIFTEQEIKESKGNVKSLAGKFAAKEAFIKTRTNEKFQLIDIQILKKQKKPYILYKNQNYYGLSISHENNYAIAIVIN